MIKACSTHTFVTRFPHLLDDLHDKVLLKETPVLGSLLMRSIHTVECKEEDVAQFPLIDPGESVDEYVEGFYDAKHYDLTKASIRDVQLSDYVKNTDGGVEIFSNAANYLLNLQVRAFVKSSEIHALGGELERLLMLPKGNGTDLLKEKVSLLPAYRPPTYIARAHQQLLGIFGQSLLDNATLIMDYEGVPHRVISRHHLVGDLVAVEETLHIPVCALADKMELAEIFIIPEAIFQELAKLCCDHYVETWDYIDATQILVGIHCERPAKLNLTLDWIFDLPLKEIPESLKKEEIVMLSNNEPAPVLVLVNLTDKTEYVFRKKSPYDKAPTAENE
jgi:hypothetical protein